MYVIKIFNGYVTKEGKRSYDKREAKFFNHKEKAEQLAYVIGGRVKKVELQHS